MARKKIAAVDLNPDYISVQLGGLHCSGFFDEPDSFMNRYHGKVSLFADDREVTVGKIEATFVNVEGAMNQRMSVRDVFDTEQGTFDIYQDLYDLDSDTVKESITHKAFGYIGGWIANVLIIERVTIDPPFRGHHFALAAMRAVMLALQPGAHAVVIKPFPLQFEGKFIDDQKEAKPDPLRLAVFSKNERASTTKLQQYYGRLGFKKIARTPYMMRLTETPLPSIEQIMAPASAAKAGRARRPATLRASD